MSYKPGKHNKELFYLLSRSFVRLISSAGMGCKPSTFMILFKTLRALGVASSRTLLDQMIDTVFMEEVGKEIASLFKDNMPTKILTIEASGIGIAVAAGTIMKIPVLVAKKSLTSNVSKDVYTTTIHSFTHNTDNQVIVSREYLGGKDKILIIDDFLANGCALEGLIKIVEEAGASLIGCCVAIEKGFQHGGDLLREKGYRIESLAIIDEMDENRILFR